MALPIARKFTAKGDDGKDYVVIERTRKKSISHFGGPSLIDDPVFELENGEELKPFAFGVLVTKGGVHLTEVDA